MALPIWRKNWFDEAYRFVLLTNVWANWCSVVRPTAEAWLRRRRMSSPTPEYPIWIRPS